MMQTKGQQQTFQCTINEGSQNRRCRRGTCDPDPKCIDTCLNHRPDNCHNQGSDCGIENDSQWNKAFAVKESQCFRQFTEIIVFIVDGTADKTRNNTNKYPHIQSRRAQNRSKVIFYQHFLSEEGTDNGAFHRKHIRCYAKYRTCDTVDQNKCNDRRKGTAGSFLRPRATDSCRKQDMQIGNDCPTDIFHGGTNDHQE